MPLIKKIIRTNKLCIKMDFLFLISTIVTPPPPKKKKDHPPSHIKRLFRNCSHN